MSTTKHTPGPWVVAGKPDMTGYHAGMWEIYDKPFGISIIGYSHSESDARLIAAAPDLLEALEKVIDAYSGQVTRFGTYGHELDAARAAIAKATSND